MKRIKKFIILKEIIALLSFGDYSKGQRRNDFDYFRKLKTKQQQRHIKYLIREMYERF
jgi:hypothetical protein